MWRNAVVNFFNPPIGRIERLQKKLKDIEKIAITRKKYILELEDALDICNEKEHICEAMRKKYPAVQDAWERYEIMKRIHNEM